MKNKLSINSIHISGFRGYNKEEIIELNGKSALIFGDNYAGKSSTIGAIEWCMFGDFRSVKIDKNTVGSELVNNHCSNALVKINFVDEDGKHITIERNKQRDKGKSKTSLTTDEGNSVSEDGAEIFKLTKLGIEDFIRSVYLHQEDIRDVITEDRTVRSEALDRLFGLEELRNISDSIRATSINQTITSISNTRDSIITSISARLAEANKGLHESKENVRKLGISIDKINMTYVNKIVKNSFDLIRENLPSNSSIKNKEAANYYDVDDIAKELHSLVSKVRRSMPENDELQRINNKLSELDTASGDLAAYRTKLTGAKNDISVFNKENGTQKTINAAKNKLKRKIDSLNVRYDSANSKSKLIQAGLKYLEENKTIKCPVCKNQIKQENVLEYIREQAKKEVSAELKDIDEEIEKSNLNIKEINNLLEKITDLEGKRSKANDAVIKKISDVSQILKKALNPQIIDTELEKETKNLKEKKEGLEAPIIAREEILAKIEENTDSIDAICGVIKYEERCSRITELQTREEIKKIETATTMLTKLKKQCEMINDVTKELQSEMANNLVKTYLPSIREFYKKLIDHPYFDNIDIEVERDSRTSKNTYIIKGVSEKNKYESLVSQRFSTGHMNCVSLAIFLGLANTNAYNHKLNFLIMDDPSQNLDTRHKTSLAKLLSEMMNKKQLIVSTQDLEFMEILKREVNPNQAVRIELGEWSIEGPKIKVIK